jgi:hypothetical protein
MTSKGHQSPPLSVFISPLSGRSYHATCDLVKDTCVLDVSTPYADTIYKRFRTEVCAECWRYECGTRSFLTCRDFAEAGLQFCDTVCRDAWLRREGEVTVEMLKILESARIRNGKERAKAETDGSEGMQQVTEEDIIRAWENVVLQEKQPKILRKWAMIQLDDFGADQARYVLLALIHSFRESNLCTSAFDDQSSFPTAGIGFGGATWRNFAGLQSGELQQVSRFPELLWDHIRIYQVLKSRLCSRISKHLSDTSATHDNGPDPRSLQLDLADVITTENVRTALSIEPSNSFGIWQVPVTDESEGLGFGVYPTPSFFNHCESCIFSTTSTGVLE